MKVKRKKTSSEVVVPKHVLRDMRWMGDARATALFDAEQDVNTALLKLNAKGKSDDYVSGAWKVSITISRLIRKRFDKRLQELDKLT